MTRSTTDAAQFLLRLYVEKLDSRYKAPVDKAIQFVLDSQYPVGGWPQRFPLRYEFAKNGLRRLHARTSRSTTTSRGRTSRS